MTYPAALTSFTDPTTTSKLNSPSHADQHININTEVENIEAELGIDPAGAYATVKARLNAELAALHFDIDAAAATTGTAVTQFFVAPYSCTLAGYVNHSVSSGTGRSVSVVHGSAGSNCLVTATQVTTGTIGAAVAFTASLATVTAGEVMSVTCTSCATAQRYGVTIIMTNPT